MLFAERFTGKSTKGATVKFLHIPGYETSFTNERICQITTGNLLTNVTDITIWPDRSKTGVWRWVDSRSPSGYHVELFHGSQGSQDPNIFQGNVIIMEARHGQGPKVWEVIIQI